LLVSLAFCNTVTQTDWSGGDGVPGPVLDWGTTYNATVGVKSTGMGTLSLSNIVPVEYSVDNICQEARSVYSTDIDNDGDNDILVAGEYFAWWENSNTSLGVVWIEHIVDTLSGQDICAADFDGDGDMDILGIIPDYWMVSWWENTNGVGTAWEMHTVTEGSAFQLAISASDLNGDGYIDVIVGRDGTPGFDSLRWYQNANGSGTVWSNHYISSNASSDVSIADFDADGDMDILSNGTLWENLNGVGTSWQSYDFSNAFASSAVDLDNDGDMDVLIAGYQGVNWWENSGGDWIQHSLDGSGYGVGSIVSSDINGDGYSDVLASYFTTGRVVWWESINAMSTSWIKHTLINDFNSASSVFTEDINGDNCKDVIAVSYDINEIKWWDAFVFETEGTLESSILDVQDANSWSLFLSDRVVSDKTSLRFQFRSSEDAYNMGAWSDTVYLPNMPLSGILSDSTQFLQYKVIMSTADSSRTPVLSEVSFLYTSSVEIEDSNFNEISSWSFLPVENPSNGLFSATITVPNTGFVSLSIFDIFGRVISDYSQNFTRGSHMVNIFGLPEGVYFCVMNAENFTSTERIVVLK